MKLNDSYLIDSFLDPKTYSPKGQPKSNKKLDLGGDLASIWGGMLVKRSTKLEKNKTKFEAIKTENRASLGRMLDAETAKLTG